MVLGTAVAGLTQQIKSGETYYCLKPNQNKDMQFKAICNPMLLLQRLPAKTFLVMRLTAILLFAGFLQVSPHGYSQAKITLSEKKASLEKVFNEIEKQTGYSIWYERSFIEKANKIDIDVKNATIEKVLDICLKNQLLAYHIVGNIVVIKSKIETTTGTH